MAKHGETAAKTSWNVQLIDKATGAFHYFEILILLLTLFRQSEVFQSQQIWLSCLRYCIDIIALSAAFLTILMLTFHPQWFQTWEYLIVSDRQCKRGQRFRASRTGVPQRCLNCFPVRAAESNSVLRQLLWPGHLCSSKCSKKTTGMNRINTWSSWSIGIIPMNKSHPCLEFLAKVECFRMQNIMIMSRPFQLSTAVESVLKRVRWGAFIGRLSAETAHFNIRHSIPCHVSTAWPPAGHNSCKSRLRCWPYSRIELVRWNH